MDVDNDACALLKVQRAIMGYLSSLLLNMSTHSVFLIKNCLSRFVNFFKSLTMSPTLK